MTEQIPIRDYYEQQPYPDGVYHFTHPAHVGAMAQVYGHPGTPDPGSAHILEVGCGQGANLIRIASDLPRADCTGIDLADVHISEAKRQSDEAGLENVRFVRADILEQDFSGQCFDYIIAHGFFAWVPAEVKDRLLSLCHDHLAPDGVAMITYNCLPGWSTRSGLRLLMQMENEAMAASGRELLHGMERVKGFLDRTLPAVEHLPHGPLLRNEIENLRRKAPDIILHDELEPLNEPLYLLQFAQWAQAHGMAYIGDTSLINDWLAIYPKEVKQGLAEYQMSRMQGLQYADFLMNRDFRRSIICPLKAGEAISGHPVPDQLRGLWVASRLRAVTSDKKHGSTNYHFVPEQNLPAQKPMLEKLTDSDPVEQAFLDELAGSLGQFHPIEEVFVRSCSQVGISADGHESWDKLGSFVLEKVAQGFLRVSRCG